VYSGGRISALTRQAGQAAEAAGAARLRARQLVAFGAARAFRILLATQEEIGVAAQNLAAATDHLRVAGERFAARAAARFDVLRAEVQAEEARQETIRADGNLLTARAQLLQALGLATGEYRALPLGAAVSAPSGIDELIAAAARQRPDLQGLARQLAAAEAGVAAARAERYPTLALAADYQVVTPESTTVFSRWSVGALVSLPILDGGRAGARSHEAEAALVQARAALDLGRRQVEAEVRQAAARVASAAALVRVAVRQIEQAEELSRLADVRFAGGGSARRPRLPTPKGVSSAPATGWCAPRPITGSPTSSGRLRSDRCPRKIVRNERSRRHQRGQRDEHTESEDPGSGTAGARDRRDGNLVRSRPAQPPGSGDALWQRDHRGHRGRGWGQDLWPAAHGRPARRRGGASRAGARDARGHRA